MPVKYDLELDILDISFLCHEIDPSSQCPTKINYNYDKEEMNADPPCYSSPEPEVILQGAIRKNVLYLTTYAAN